MYYVLDFHEVIPYKLKSEISFAYPEMVNNFPLGTNVNITPLSW